MTILARFDPGVGPLIVGATAAAIAAVASLGSEALARAFGRLGPATRHDIQVCGLILILLAPALALGVGRTGLVLVAWPASQAPEPEADAPPRPTRPVPRPSPVPGPVEPWVGPVAPGPAEIAPVPTVREAEPAPAPPLPARVVEPAPPRVEETPDGRSALVGGLVAAWAAGFVALALRLAWGIGLVARLRRRSRPVDLGPIAAVLDQVRRTLGTATLPPIREAPGLAGPVAGGVFRPVVILPEGMTGSLGPGALRDVLIHEAAHVLRRDPVVRLLQRGAAALFWPHPPVHRLNGRITRAREEACDDRVLRAGDRRGYARTLLLLADRSGRNFKPGGALVGLFASRWKLEDRVAGILDPKREPTMNPKRWQTAVAALTLGAASVAVAAIRPRAEATAAPAAAGSADEGMVSIVAGLVVDEAGAPVAGATVNATWSREGPEDATTGPDGRFSLRITGLPRWLIAIRAVADGGTRVGIAESRGPIGSRPGPVRIVLKPARVVVARVVDAGGRPVAGAAVEVLSRWNGPIDRGVADAAGLARFALPADAMVESVAALKAGVGFDYFENYRSWPSTRRDPLPAEITLTLDGALAASVRVIDSAGRPIAGVTLQPRQIQKPGKLSSFDVYEVGITAATTDARGIARFDWWPKGSGEQSFMELLPCDYTCPRPPTLRPGSDAVPEARLLRDVRLAGKVTNPDGSPASGVLVRAAGRGRETINSYGFAKTGADGSYSLALPPDQFAMIAVADVDHAAPPLTGIITREGQPQTGLDLRLVAGARFRARITTEAGGPPVPGAWFSIDIIGPPVPKEFQADGGDPLDVHITDETDADGRVERRLAPGVYTIRDQENLHVQGPGDIAREFHRKPKVKAATLGGIVVDATGAANRPVAGALVRYWPPGWQGALGIVAQADASGRFEFEAIPAAGSLVVAKDRAGTIAGSLVVPDGVAEVRVGLAPAATVAGRVVDAGGRAVAGRRVQLMATITRSPLPPARTVDLTVTDAEGRYSFAGLIPGGKGEIGVHPAEFGDGRGGIWTETFTVRGADPITLPDVTVDDGTKPDPPPAPGAVFTAADVASLDRMPWMTTEADVSARATNPTREAKADADANQADIVIELPPGGK